MSATRPRLLLVTTSPMALAHFFVNQARMLYEFGFDVTALSSDDMELEDFRKRSGIPSLVVPIRRQMAPWADIISFLRLWRAVWRHRPVIVHTHTPKAGLLGMAAARLAGIPVRIYTINGFPLVTRSGWRRWILILAERMACRLATRVLCVSSSLRATVIRMKICQDGKIAVLAHGSSHGVDLSRFHPSPRHDTGILGFVGRLTRDKGIDVLAAAWKRLREDFPGLRLWLCGMFEDADPVSPATRASFENDPRVRIFRARPEEMPEVYRSLDLCLLPTFREGLPNVALECAAAGVPIVATRIPGCVDAVIDGTTGVLVPPGDADALAGAAAALLRDPGRRRQMGAAAREFVASRFDERVLASLLVDEYNRLIETARRKRAARFTLKRLFDIAAASILAVLLSPLILIAALAVRLAMGSPVFFRQQRAGLFGRLFSLWKLRTMSGDRNADGKLPPDDRRLTTIGGFLRRTSIDELPQLWNVIKGDMSLAGPRPLHAHYVARYDESQKRRLEARPGFTGWAQVHGRNALSWEDRFRLDVWYVDHRTFPLDLKILALTAWKVLRREGIGEPGAATMTEFMGSGGSPS